MQYQYIDLTHIVSDNMPVFPGDTPVQLKSIVTVEEYGVANHMLTGSLHMGTHIDAPGHFIAGDKKITDFSISTFIGPAVCIDARGKQEIGIDTVINKVSAHDIVLFYTGFDVHYFQKNYFYDYPILSQECAQYLVDMHVKMVGLDCPSVDKAPYVIHKLLLGNEILIIENLTHLEKLLPCRTIELIAFPLNIDAHGAPARVVAKIII